jgi:chromosome segregation ATPase
MDPQELAEKLEALEGQVADLTKRAEGAEADLAALQKAADEAGFDVEEGKLTKRADPEYVEVEGERFEKAAIPATILKALEAKEAELAKAKQEQEEVTLAKRGAAELPHLRTRLRPRSV